MGNIFGARFRIGQLACRGEGEVFAVSAPRSKSAGVEFITENGGGVGVRQRKPGPGATPVSIKLEDLNAENDE